LPHRHNPSA